MSASSPLKLCVSTLRYHPVYAGPAIRFRRYAPGLTERGLDVNVVTVDGSSSGSPGSRGRNWTSSPDSVDGVPVYRVPAGGPGEGRLEVALARGMVDYSREVRKPSVVQLLSVSYRFVPWLVRLRREGIPIIFTRTMVRDPSVAAYKNLPNLFAYRFVDCIVVSTGVMRDALREEGYRGRIEVIPNGVDTQRFQPVASEEEREALRSRLGLPAGAELVVFVGGFLSERKGVDVLADAWRVLAPRRPRAVLVLVGPQIKAEKDEGPQRAFIDGVLRSLDASGARDRVVFTGAVDRVDDYLRAADVFVFPSRREGMPNVVPEAFACGAPTVLTPFIGLPDEFGRAGEHYVLSEREPEALARAVSQILDQPERRRSLAAAARRWVQQELDVERSLDRYADLYREMANGTGSR